MFLLCKSNEQHPSPRVREIHNSDWNVLKRYQYGAEVYDKHLITGEVKQINLKDFPSFHFFLAH